MPCFKAYLLPLDPKSTITQDEGLYIIRVRIMDGERRKVYRTLLPNDIDHNDRVSKKFNSKTAAIDVARNTMYAFFNDGLEFLYEGNSSDEDVKVCQEILHMEESVQDFCKAWIAAKLTTEEETTKVVGGKSKKKKIRSGSF